MQQAARAFPPEGPARSMGLRVTALRLGPQWPAGNPGDHDLHAGPGPVGLLAGFPGPGCRTPGAGPRARRGFASAGHQGVTARATVAPAAWAGGPEPRAP